MKVDRFRILVWILALTLLTVITGSAFTGLYQSDQERMAIAETMRNPAMTAMVGPGYGLDNYTEGPMMAHQMLLFTAIAVAIMSVLLVTRHTRTDEEEGRMELVRSLPVGKLANLTATMSIVVLVNSLLALVIGFGLAALRVESMDLIGSLFYGAALGATGVFFTAVTAIFAQLSDNSRGTIGFSLLVLGGAYIIRAVGDVSNEVLSMLSPLGWILRTEVYVSNYWWPIISLLAVSAVLFVIAFYLCSIRDMGSGFLPTRVGRKHASRFLQSPLGLATKLQRTSIISWAVGMFILGITYGSVFGDLEYFFENNEIIAEMFTATEGFTLTEQFLSMLMAVISMICTVPVLLFLLKIKQEERRNRMEHLMSHAISRTRVLGSYFILSFFFSFALLFLSVLGLWSAAIAVMEERISFPIIFQSAIVYLPAMWVMIGVALLTVGAFPRWTNVSWLYLGYSFIVVYLGGLLQFPEWMAHLSPFGYVPQLPIEDVNYLKIIILISVAVVLSVSGFFGYRRRDITG